MIDQSWTRLGRTQHPRKKKLARIASYTFPQFIFNERTGQLAANLIDSGSGRVLQHITSAALHQIIQDYLAAKKLGQTGEDQDNRQANER